MISGKKAFFTVTKRCTLDMLYDFLILQDHDSHGPEFHKHMFRINKLTGANITVSLLTLSQFSLTEKNYFFTF